MSEKPLQPGIERVQKSPKTIEHEWLYPIEGGVLERVVECNGQQHREVLEELYFDAGGNIWHVVELEKTDLGACTC